MSVEIVIDADLTEGIIATARLTMDGRTVLIMAELIVDRQRMTLGGLHIFGQGSAANAFGNAWLRRLAREVMDELGLDELVAVGSVRTTGARPGRLPRPIRIARHRAPDR